MIIHCIIQIIYKILDKVEGKQINTQDLCIKPVPLIEQTWDFNVIPLVSISCIGYNHERYIRDAIEGFLRQETAFPVEILIHDDSSTDKTADIVEEYEAKYPHLIKPIYQTENQYSKGVSISATFNWPRARGKYIALCEGDDYWIDPLKLQKQVDFLEENPEYGLVHGDCHFYYQDKDKWEYYANKFLSNKNKIKNKEELFSRLIDADYKIRTATTLFKRDLLSLIPANDVKFFMGDTPMWLDFSQKTKFKYLDEVFAVYRILSNSVSRSENKKKQYRFGLSMVEMRIYYSYKYNYPINNKLKRRYNDSLLTYKLYDPNYKAIYPLYNPTAYQRFKINNMNSAFFKNIFRLENFMLRLVKASIKKL